MKSTFDRSLCFPDRSVYHHCGRCDAVRSSHKLIRDHFRKVHGPTMIAVKCSQDCPLRVSGDLDLRNCPVCAKREVAK